MSEELQDKGFGGDKDIVRPDTDRDGGERGPRSRRRRKVSYLTINKIETVDYKEVNILRRFINDRGKMLPTRQTGNTAKQQRMISKAIRRAREMALLPFVVTEFSGESRPPRVRRPRPDRYDEAPRQAEVVETPAAEVEATTEE